MRPARPGKERHVVRLMNLGKRDEALAYMKKNGIIQSFIGAPEYGSIGHSENPEPKVTVVQLPEEYKYPDFKPVRDPLPEGVVYVRVKRELSHQLQKIITFEDDNHLPEHRRREGLLWMSIREQEQQLKRGRLIGQVLAAEPNPDDRQGGLRVYRR